MDFLQKNTMPDQYSNSVQKKSKSTFLKSLFNFGACAPADFDDIDSERKIYF